MIRTVSSALIALFLAGCACLHCASASAAETALASRLAALASSARDPETAELARVLERSANAYEPVRDYRSEFLKQEFSKSKGKLGPRETIFLKFEKPFKIFMRWMDTHKSGLQVLYHRGHHGGKLGIHKPGLLLGLAPVVFLDQNSPWVREGSEAYNIEDAGIGTFLNDFSEMVLAAAAEGKIRASVSETPEGSLVDVSFPGAAKSSIYFASRVTVFFDAQNKLPVRMQLYNWSGQLKGNYEYNKLELNVGAEDPEFKKLAQRKLYHLFRV